MDRLMKYVKDIRKAKYFDIQNVSDYFWQYPEDGWTLDKFSIAPPFDFFATIYRSPKELGYEHGDMDFLTVFRIVDEPPPMISDINLGGDNVEMNPHLPTIVPGAKWHMVIYQFASDTREVAPPAVWFVAVGDKGQIADYNGYPALWITDTALPPGLIGIITNSFLQVSFLALTFLHSKNVEIIEPPPPSKKKKRKPRKRHFEVKYHRLKVNAIGATEQTASSRGPKTGIKHALHIVRGHFREYGEEFGKGKLFGRLSGRFWVASHLKGDKAIGKVDKDYNIE